jgi:hypothetical protein
MLTDKNIIEINTIYAYTLHVPDRVSYTFLETVNAPFPVLHVSDVYTKQLIKEYNMHA